MPHTSRPVSHEYRDMGHDYWLMVKKMCDYWLIAKKIRGDQRTIIEIFLSIALCVMDFLNPFSGFSNTFMR